MEQELLEKALMFIARNFADKGKFYCPCMPQCYNFCTECKIKKDVCDILGIE